MPVALHVWGPAFGLPSIDPQCLAAILYLQQALPTGQWEVIATSDNSLSPTRKLPALQDEDHWIGGLSNIIDYLGAKSNTYDPDASFDPTKRADITAYTNHVVTHGAPLLDAYLFTTSENYLKTTRPALSNLLPWPLTWTVTPTLHAEARARTERLGISASEILAAETHEASTASTGSDIVPKSLRTTKESLSNLMRRPEHASRFRLEAMADHFLKPLRSLISDQQYMMSPSQMSSLDCVAIAYLALMLQPDAPQPWLRDIILQRYPALETYVETVLKHFVRANVATDKTLQPGDLRKGENKPNNTADGLPWQTWSTLSISDRISTIANSAMTNPLDATVIEHGRVVGKPGPQSTVPLLFGLLGLVTSIGTYLGYAYNEARRPKSTLSDMGEAGAMLGSLDFGMGDDRTSLPGEGRVPEQPNGTRMTFRRA